MFPCNFPRVTGRRTVSGLVLVFLASVFLLAGCGGKDGGDKSGGSTVLATVGDTDITAEMYETGLAKMEKGDLPVDDLGQPVDTATQAGKQEFLEVLINKELLRQKALQLGYDQDPQALGAKASSPGCSEMTFAHGGATGTLAWADPATDTVCVVLTTLPDRAANPHRSKQAAEQVAAAGSQS